MADSKGTTSTSISRKEVSDRIAKGLCRLCGDKWDKNHTTKCKVWGKLNAIFMVQEGIVLGHKISVRGKEVDNVIEKLPPPLNVKGIRSFLGHAGFCLA